MEDSSPIHNRQEDRLKGFNVTFALSQAFGITAVVVTAVWLSSHLGGFGYPAIGGLNFNYHPLFMIIGMVFLYGEGLITYRVLRNERKKTLKLIHFTLMASCIILLSIGLKAVFDSHNYAKPPIPNLYSAHSWLGILTIALFSCQLFFGFITFLVPGLRSPVRGAYLPWHTTFGVIIFVMAIATSLMGVTEKAIFSLGKTYGMFPTAAYLINLLILLLVAFGGTIVFIVVNPAYRRIQLPEDEITLLARSID